VKRASTGRSERPKAGAAPSRRGLGAMASFLGGVPACAGMSEEELRDFASFMSSRRLREGEILFNQGDAGDELFVVRSGSVGLFLLEKDGSHWDVAEFGPGRLFGEMAIVEKAARSASCRAKTEAKLLALSGGDFDRLVEERPRLARILLANMIRSLDASLNATSGYLGDLVKWGEAARRRSIIDELTGLFNRRFLEETMRSRMGKGVDTSRPCSLISMDVDRFREVNAAHGSAGGDAVIAAVGRRIGEVVTASAIVGASAARLSGDEFWIFLPESGLEGAMTLAEAIRAAVESLDVRLASAPGPVRVTTSLGVADAPRCGTSLEALNVTSDKGLYAAKESGRNAVAPAPLSSDKNP
jgi:diguanylate cyclase (GGDEF)-like protein